MFLVSMWLLLYLFYLIKPDDPFRISRDTEHASRCREMDETIPPPPTNFDPQFEYNPNIEYFVGCFTFLGILSKKGGRILPPHLLFIWEIFKTVKPLQDKISLSVLGAVYLRNPLITTLVVICLSGTR